MLRSQRSITCALALALACAAGCDRHRAAPMGDAEAGRTMVVQVPAALRIARGLDTLSVELDPDLLAKTTVHVDPGRTVGVAYTTRVYERGKKRLQSERHGYVSGRGFDLGTSIWHTATDGLPQRGKKYRVEMELVLFETDVKPGPHWNPHAGHFHVLLERTLRQAEE